LYPANNLQEDCTQFQAVAHQIIHNAKQDPILQDMVAHIDLVIILANPFANSDNG